MHLGRISGELPHRRHDRFAGAARRPGLAVRGDWARCALEYDPRDLVDRRIHSAARGRASVPTSCCDSTSDYSWNFKRMFKQSGPREAEGTRARLRRLRGGRLGAPPRRAAAPDDAVASRRLAAGARSATAPSARTWRARTTRSAARATDSRQTYRWTDAYVAASHMRLADPDSAARLFRVDTLHAVESTPTFRWRNVKATRAPARRLGVDRRAALGPPGVDRSRGGKDRVGKRSPRALRASGSGATPCR